VFDYLFNLTNYTTASAESQAKIKKSLYYYVVPYFAKQRKNVSIAEQIRDRCYDF
jgi:hypothetical protein